MIFNLIGIPFWGHRQTVQTQIRLFAHRNFCQKHDKNEKNKTKNRHPLSEKWTRPIDKDGKVH